jgi:hypothetical protein
MVRKKWRYGWEKDTNGNKYRKVYINGYAKCIICLSGTNTLYWVMPNISLRDGTSKLGSEAVMQFKIEKVEKTYPATSPWEHIEIYFSVDDMRFLCEKILALGKMDKDQKVLSVWRETQ